MRSNRRTDTGPERLLRSTLHRHGHRFRKDFALAVGDRRVRPDIVFTRKRVAVFLDGCFWHRCPLHATDPKSNTAYWKPKLEANVARDRAVDAALASAGWVVVRVWEHEDPLEAAARIGDVLVRRSNHLPHSA